MKIREGFVSNSSSTSFVIATKEPLTKEVLLAKLGEYFSSIFGIHAYYKIMSRIIPVFFDGKEEIPIDRLSGYRITLHKDLNYKYIYMGETTCLNQDDWANVDSCVIDTHIYIHDDDFYMVSDEDC